MYLNFYELEKRPFHLTPDPNFIFLSKKHQESFANLLYSLESQSGFAELSGEIGAGKTTVLRSVFDQLDHSVFRTALILNPCLSIEGLMKNILREYDLPCEAGEVSEMVHTLNGYLIEQKRQGRTVVLAIDEAQNLEPKVLEQIRILSNLETETEKLLLIILVGQPELGDLLERPDMVQLNQRVSVRYHLTAMDFEDTCAYVRHRLEVAGSEDKLLFSRDALRGVYNFSKGLPRLINIICDRALLVGYEEESHRITGSVVKKAAGEVKSVRPAIGKPAGPTLARWGLRLGLTTACLLLAFFGGKFVPKVGVADRAPASPQIADLPKKSPLSPVEAETEAVQQEAGLDEEQEEEPAYEAEYGPGNSGPANDLAVEAAEAPVEVAEVPPEQPFQAQVLERLRENVRMAGRIGSARVAINALLGMWRPVSIEASSDLSTGAAMVRAVRKEGMDLTAYRGDLEGLLRIGNPALLTINLPGVKGNRYLAMTAADDDLVQVVDPGTGENLWLSKKELQKLWFGHARIPWRNFEKIPRLATPGFAGAGVGRLQELLLMAGASARSPSLVYDQATIDEITDFQRTCRIAPDGRVGPQTLIRLYATVYDDLPRLGRGPGG